MNSCKIMKTSEFFTKNVNPFLLGAFFSRYVFVNDNKYIVAYSSFYKSPKITVPNLDLKKYYATYRDILNEESGDYPYWQLKKDISKDIKLPKAKIFFILENDLNILPDKFYNKLYGKLYNDCDWIFSDDLTEDKKRFIRGYMELRGSIDRSRNFISQDYFYNSKFEISKGRILIERLNIPYYNVNFNFRELQSQYIDGIMRNTQYRINLKWYLKNIGIMNEYKKDLYEIGTGLTHTKKEGNVWYFDYEDEVVSRESNLIDERINYYLNKIFGKNLSNKEIVKMRQELEFDATPNSVRDNTLVKLIQLNYPDECVACKDDYDISDRSFKKKNSDRYYFEVHHVISIGKDKELDDENNLVKLCPTCHDLLKRGRASEKEQKDLIRKIFKNAPNTLEFAKNFFNTDDYEEIVQKTYQNLK